jgi:PII-like signaling protein
MTVREPGRRLTIYVGETDHARQTHQPLYEAILHRAVQAGLAGGSVFRGWEGFGSSDQIHTTRLLSLAEDLPIAIIIVDTAERIDAFVPELDDLIDTGTVVVDDVEIIRYPPSRSRGDSG